MLPIIGVRHDSPVKNPRRSRTSIVKIVEATRSSQDSSLFSTLVVYETAQMKSGTKRAIRRSRPACRRAQSRARSLTSALRRALLKNRCRINTKRSMIEEQERFCDSLRISEL